MSNADQRTDETPLPVFIVDEFTQFTQCLAADGGQVPHVEVSQSLREIFERSRSHPIRISTALSAPVSNGANR